MFSNIVNYFSYLEQLLIYYFNKKDFFFKYFFFVNSFTCERNNAAIHKEIFYQHETNLLKNNNI